MSSLAAAQKLLMICTNSFVSRVASLLVSLINYTTTFMYVYYADDDADDDDDDIQSSTLTLRLSPLARLFTLHKHIRTRAHACTYITHCSPP